MGRKSLELPSAACEKNSYLNLKKNNDEERGDVFLTHLFVSFGSCLAGFHTKVQSDYRLMGSATSCR